MQPLVRFALMLALSTCGLAFAQDERFDIRRFAVEGNTLLAPAHIEGLVAPFLGAKRNYGDIQKALEALEGAYRSGGYGTVQVYVPEQELTHGVVRLQVTEGVIGKISIIGNKHFDSDNVRGTLPSLAPGKAPNMRQISEDIQLANENPAKQIEVTLGVSEEEGKVDAKVNVTDDNPEKFIVSLDNTGTAATGKWRAGFAYQNANVGNRDQVVTVAYTDSPDKPSGVKVEIYSFAYRLPLYSIGDSVDIIYGKSSVNTPNAQATGFSLNGKGDVLGLRWNHYFARRGEYTSKLIGGFDYKYINTRCLNNATGAAFHIDPPTPGNAACTPYTVRPFSLTYTGQRQSPGQILDYSLGVYQNWATGTRYAFRTTTGAAGFDHYSVMNNDGDPAGVGDKRATPDGFNSLKATFSYLHALPGNWAMRGAFSGQYSQTALPASEQFGIAGSTAVRGFNERAVAMDKGYFVNLEVYSPELASDAGLPGSLKAIGFYDFGRSANYLGARSGDVGAAPFEKAGIASIGAGLRFALGKEVNLRADLAHIIDAGPADIRPGNSAANPANTETRGDWRGHFGLQLAF